MPRKGHTLKRDVLADPIYNSKVVTKLINSIMLDGKKGIAQKIVYGAFEQVNAETGKDAIEVFEVSSQIKNRRWNTETLERDRMFLEYLGVQV